MLENLVVFDQSATARTRAADQDQTFSDAAKAFHLLMNVTELSGMVAVTIATSGHKCGPSTRTYLRAQKKSYARTTALEVERNASLCSFDCDNGGTASQPCQPNGNLLLLGSFRGQPETSLGLSVF
jgi:hypothetical protein